MKATILASFLLLLANYQIATCQFTSQIFQQFLNRPVEVIENYPPPNVVSNRPLEVCENFAYSSPSVISNRPIEIIENFAYPPQGVISNRQVEIVENVVYPNVINEQFCTGVPLPPVQECVPSGNTILITDCSPEACQNLADTLQLMIVCNMLQNTQRGKEFALQLAGPVIKQLISSPVLSCGCANPIFPAISSSNPPCPNFAPNIVTPSVVTSDIVSSSFVSGPMYELGSNLVSVNAPSSCSCQTLSGTISTCPCQACASPSCSCQLSSPLFSCQKCLASSPCQKSSSAPCQKCSAPAPTCPCQSCSSSAPSIPPPPPPAPSCSCQTCTSCPNCLNSILSSFLNFL